MKPPMPSQNKSQLTDDDALPFWAFFRRWQQLDQESGHQSVDLNAYYLLIDTVTNGIAVGNRDALLAVCRGLLLKPHHNRAALEDLFNKMWERSTDDQSGGEHGQHREQDTAATSPKPSTDSEVEPDELPKLPNMVELKPVKPEPKSEIATTKVAVRFSALGNNGGNGSEANDWKNEANARPYRIEGSYEPLEERAMRQHVRQLRQQTYRNTRLEVDLGATIGRITQQGFFDGLVRKRNIRYEVPLTLLIDRRGSMVPFHHLSDQLAEAVLEQPGGSVRYFQNCFEKFLFRTPFLTEPELIESWKRTVPDRSLVVILSDAGAARGFYNQVRIEQMRRMVTLLDQCRTVWLNPMPRDRWWATSAAAIATDVPMYALDEVEMGTAIKNLNGLLLTQS